MKKGAVSHLEMIISFTLFIFVVLFILAYIRPYKVSSLSDSIIVSLKDSFLDKYSANLTEIFLKSDTLKCFSLDFSNLNLYNQGIFVKSTDGIRAEAGFDNNVLTVNSNKNFFYVLISDEFPENKISACQISENYAFGSIKNKKIISSKKLNELKKEYIGDYDNLKMKMGVPKSINFAIIFNDTILQKNIPEKTEVISRAYNLEVLNELGEIYNLEFIFKIW
jgi:hypothetical protein